MPLDQAPVLGGGGVAGIAWMTGLLAGLADAGHDVTGAGTVIGTSAGATVAAQLGSGLPLDDLYARQADPALQPTEIPAYIDTGTFAARWQEFAAGARTPHETLLAAGKFALAAATVAEARRRAVIASRLPSHDWPARAIRLVAVDCENGATVQFSAASGVSLVDAVAASCAVPGIWPPVTIGGRRYMDGGTRNADLAAGAARVTVASPLGMNSEAPARCRCPARSPGSAPAAHRSPLSSPTLLPGRPSAPTRSTLKPAPRRPSPAAPRDAGACLAPCGLGGRGRAANAGVQ